MFEQELIKKLDDRSALIGVIGLGYVGLPLLLSFSEAGYGAMGFDIDEEKIRSLSKGKSYIDHIPSQRIKDNQANNRFDVTSDFVRAREMDALIICVPTPLNKYREPDLSYVIATMEAVLPHMRRGQVVSLESTTFPGTTEEELKPRIESANFTVGEDYFLVYSPEREDPVNPDFTTRTIPKVFGGTTKACLAVGHSLYGAIIDQVVPVSSTRTAEMTKLLENIHRAVNIGLVNEMKIVADKMGIDIHEVIRSAATKPFGFVPYYPGPGLGGHCIPIDPFYLTWKAREYGVHTRFIELAGEVNSGMPAWVVEKISDGLNRASMPVRGSRILVLGIAYKKNVDDVRESPSVEIMEQLYAKGAEVDYSDPHLPEFPRMRAHHFDLKSVAVTAESLAEYHCVVIATDHDAFDYALIHKHARLIVDTRGVFTEPSNTVIKA